MSDLSIDLGESLPYLVEGFLEIIGKDAATQEVRRWFGELQKVGLEESSYVQAVGMHQPVPIEDMYQPTRLLWLSKHLTLVLDGNRKDFELPDTPVAVDSFLNFPSNAIVLAGPGWGKTTFVKFVFVKYARSPKSNRIPVLFTLRRPNRLRKNAGGTRKLSCFHSAN
jgi:hypothetical protein